ncbi:MAG: DUF4157 domain-containing protein, partial [Bacteroidota bacterium]
MKTAADHTSTTSTSARQQTEQQPFFGAAHVEEPAFFQPKLKVGAPNDKFEKEADAVADTVVQRLAETGARPQVPGEDMGTDLAGVETISRVQRKPIFESGNDEGEVQRKCAACAAEEEGQVQRFSLATPLPGGVQRKCAACEAEESLQPERLPNIQRSGDGSFTASANFAGKLAASRGGGAPMPEATRSSMESAVGADFSSVRLHTGSGAAELNRSIGARAFTHGSDIYFNAGQYDPGSRDGQHLLAHELVHTVQQGGSGVKRHRAKTDPEQEQGCKICEEGDKVINFKLDDTLQRAFGTPDESGLRQRIVELAEGEIGKVKARQTGGDGRRTGADELLDYFHLAAPGEWPDQVIEYNYPDFPSWCAIFAVFATKKAGIDVGDWKMGKGVSEQNTLDPTDDPQAGDIGYIHMPFQHHSIIKEVQGDTIVSIDGNSGPLSEVVTRERSRDTYTGFLTPFTGREKHLQRSADPQVAQPPVTSVPTTPSIVQRACPPDCAPGEDYEILLEPEFEGEVLAYRLGINQEAYDTLDGRGGGYAAAEGAISRAFYRQGDPIHESADFLESPRVKTLVKQDLEEWLAGPDVPPSFRRLNAFIDARISLIRDNAVLYDFEQYLEENNLYFPGELDWNVIVPQLRMRMASWEEPANILVAADYDRYALFLDIIADEVLGEDAVPGAVAVDAESFEGTTWTYVMEHFTLDSVSWETQRIHGDRFLREWLGYIETIAYIPENFVIEEFTVDEDLEERAEEERERLLAAFINDEVPDLVIMYVLDAWAISGQSPEAWLETLDLADYREELLDHLTEEFLRIARDDEDYTQALLALGVARTRIDIIRNIYFHALANELYNSGLRETFENTPIADLDESELSIAADPYTYFDHSDTIGAIIYNLLEDVTPYGPIEAELLQAGEELMAAIEAPESMKSILLVFEFLGFLQHLNRLGEEESAEIEAAIRERVEVDFDEIEEVIENLAEFAENFINNEFIPELHAVAKEFLLANQTELQSTLDNFDVNKEGVIRDFEAGATEYDALAEDLENGMYESIELDGQTITADDADKLRDAAQFMRDEAAVRRDAERSEERKGEIRELIANIDDVIEKIDDDDYDPLDYTPEIYRIAKERLGISTFPPYTTNLMVLRGEVTAEHNPFLARMITAWYFRETLDRQAYEVLLVGGQLVLGVAAIFTGGLAGLVIGVLDVAVGTAMGVRDVMSAQDLVDMARADTHGNVRGISVEQAEKALLHAWIGLGVGLVLDIGPPALSMRFRLRTADGLEMGGDIRRWERSLSDETQRFLRENSSTRRIYAEMRDDVRRLLTHCSDNCLIPGISRTQVSTVRNMIDRLGGLEPQDFANLRYLFHVGKDDLEWTFRMLNRVDDTDGLRSTLRQSFRRRAMVPPGGSPPLSPKVEKAKPGIALGGEKLPVVADGHQWLRTTGGGVGLIPRHIADRLRNRNYANFAEFRADFWREVGNDPVLSVGFSPGNVTSMRKGKAPGAIPAQQHKGQKVYEIHHITPVEHGGDVYNLDNLSIVSPRFHHDIHDGGFVSPQREPGATAPDILRKQDPKALIGGYDDCHECEREDELATGEPTVQRQEDGTASDDGAFITTDAFDDRLGVATGSGEALPAGTRERMEEGIGADFSDVRVHTGDEAASLNRGIGARAFTHGTDVFFNSGQYAPGTKVGDRLLAHELTHTVQQGAVVRRKPNISSTDKQVQTFPTSVAEFRDLLASAADDYVPAYSLLSVAIGYDFIRGRGVVRNRENIIKGVFSLINPLGSILRKRLEERGVIDDAYAWIKENFAALELTYAAVERKVLEFWDATEFARFDFISY